MKHPLNATIVISDTHLVKLFKLYNDIYNKYYAEIILFVHDDFITTRPDILDEAKEIKAHSHILTKNHTLFIKDNTKKPSRLSRIIDFFKGERKGKSKIKSKSKKKGKGKGKGTFYDSTGGNTKKMHYNKRARLRQKRSYKISHAKLHAKTQRKIHKTK
jgi:hypothetical protein